MQTDGVQRQSGSKPLRTVKSIRVVHQGHTCPQSNKPALQVLKQECLGRPLTAEGWTVPVDHGSNPPVPLECGHTPSVGWQPLGRCGMVHLLSEICTAASWSTHQIYRLNAELSCVLPSGGCLFGQLDQSGLGSILHLGHKF